MGGNARLVRLRSANLLGFGAGIDPTPESFNVSCFSRQMSLLNYGRGAMPALCQDARQGQSFCLTLYRVPAPPPLSNLRSATVGCLAPDARPSKLPVLLAPRSSNSRMSCPPCRGGIARGTCPRLRPQRCRRRRRNPAPMRLPPRAPVPEAASLYYPPCR